MSVWSLVLLIGLWELSNSKSVWGQNVFCIYILHPSFASVFVLELSQSWVLIGGMSDWLGFDWGVTEAIKDWAQLQAYWQTADEARERER